jgi:hypothetical protein
MSYLICVKKKGGKKKRKKKRGGRERIQLFISQNGHAVQESEEGVDVGLFVIGDPRVCRRVGGRRGRWLFFVIRSSNL